MTTSGRSATIERSTKETRVHVRLEIDGGGTADINTGLGFLDHMLTALAVHARLDLAIRCSGDLEVDDHHTVEDVALCLGAAFDQALGTRAGIVRFASTFAPLDEALARCVIDFSGRPSPHIHLQLTRERLGDVSCENISHFFRSFATNARCSLHLDMIRGENDHHRCEAAFKALALAARAAASLDPSFRGVPSTKGVLQS